MTVETSAAPASPGGMTWLEKCLEETRKARAALKAGDLAGIGGFLLLLEVILECEVEEDKALEVSA